MSDIALRQIREAFGISCSGLPQEPASQKQVALYWKGYTVFGDQDSIDAFNAVLRSLDLESMLVEVNERAA